MGGECGTYGLEERCILSFGGETKERNHLEDLGLNGMVVLKWIFKMWDEGVDWIGLPQDTGRWRAILNAVMKRPVV